MMRSFVVILPRDPFMKIHLNMAPYRIACLTFIIASGILAGCGDGRPSLVKVTGKVTLDGQPLEGAQVAFQPVNTDPKDTFQRPSSCISNAAGEFTPQTYLPGDGLRVGKYRVAVVKQELVGTPPPGLNAEEIQQLGMKRKWITPKAASSPETSGIEVEVTSTGMSPNVIELKSVQPAEIE
jgi:hypothetical protein